LISHGNIIAGASGYGQRLMAFDEPLKEDGKYHTQCTTPDTTHAYDIFKMYILGIFHWHTSLNLLLNHATSTLVLASDILQL